MFDGELIMVVLFCPTRLLLVFCSLHLSSATQWDTTADSLNMNMNMWKIGGEGDQHVSSRCTC